MDCLRITLPSQVVIDPYNKLIDINSSDNRTDV